MRKICIAFCLLLNVTQAIAGSYNGQVLDLFSKLSLPFVHVVYNSSGHGVVSSVDGFFSVPEGAEFLRFTYAGYEPLVVYPEVFLSRSEFLLVPKNQVKLEVKEYSGVNPAHRIIEKLVENRDLHNPDKLSSYEFQSYNKLEFTMIEDNGYLPLQKKIPSTKLDTILLRFRNHINSQHLFLIETATLKTKSNLSKEKEVVLSSKISGLDDARFMMLATNLQSLSFYNEEVRFLVHKFLSPASRQSCKKYLFELTDTLLTGQGDTVFTICFRPRKGYFFNGLVGEMNINSNGYAIQSIRAEIADKENTVINLKIEQRSEQLPDKRWFTREMNSRVVINKLKLIPNENTTFSVVAKGKSYLSGITVNPEIDSGYFKGHKLVIASHASVKDSAFPEELRSVPLNLKDMNTHHVNDSVGKAIKFNQIISSLVGLADKKLPYGKVTFRLGDVIGYNHYEGLQLGIGIETNETLSKTIGVGGYWKYGDEKKEFKYGANIDLNLCKPSETRLYGEFSHDRRAIGHLQYLEQAKAFSSEEYRELLYTDMFKYQSLSAGFDHRWTSFLKTRLNYTHYTIFDATSLNPAFANVGNYQMDKLSLKLRLSFDEKFFDNGKEIVSLGTKYPLLLLNLEKGIGNSNTTGYYSIEFKIRDSFYIRNVGTSRLNIMGGIRDEMGIANLFLSPPSANDNMVSIYTANAFATMPMNRFFANRMVAVFWEHSFGSTLYKIHRFRPQIFFVLNVGYGATNQKYAGFKSFEKGYYETGILMKKMYWGKLFAYGMGAFYRLGAYRSDQVTENLAIKFTIDIAI